MNVENVTRRIPLRSDFDAARVRAAARRTKDGARARRLLALAAIFDGGTRTEAARIGGVTLQIVRDSVIKFNAAGPAGLLDRKAPEQPSRLADADRLAVAAMPQSPKATPKTLVTFRRAATRWMGVPCRPTCWRSWLAPTSAPSGRLACAGPPESTSAPNSCWSVVRLYGAGGPDTAFGTVAAAFTAESGIKVEVTGGPEPIWSRKVQAHADIIWATAEEDMAALLETYTNFPWADVTPIYTRRAIIAVRKGNPKDIRGFEDLLKPGLRLVVTDGAGVANASGTGVWEDVAGRTGSLEDITRFRRNIVGFGKGRGPSFQMFVAKDADAWITWPDWPITHPDVTEIVDLSEQRRMWRDVSVVLVSDRLNSANVRKNGATSTFTSSWEVLMGKPQAKCQL